MNERKSFFLILALWVLTLISLFCLGLGFRTFVQVKKTKLFLNRQRAFNLAVSGVKIAKQVLEEDLNADKNSGFYVDHLQEEWAKAIEKEVEFSSPFKKGNLLVRIEDESGRFNMNNIEDPAAVMDGKSFKELFEGFFDEIEVEDYSDKIDCIFDYVDADYVSGSRSPDSDGEDKVKNEKLSVLEELLLVKGFTGKDENYSKLKDFFTVFGDNTDKLNINTAKEQILDFLFEADNSKRQDIEDVRINKKYYCDGACPVSEQECVQLSSLLTGTLFKASSDIFRIASRAEIEGVVREVISVVDRKQDKILYWYEK